jgi:hypothetical protein
MSDQENLYPQPTDVRKPGSERKPGGQPNQPVQRDPGGQPKSPRSEQEPDQERKKQA